MVEYCLSHNSMNPTISISGVTWTYCITAHNLISHVWLWEHSSDTEKNILLTDCDTRSLLFGTAVPRVVACSIGALHNRYESPY